MLSTTMLHLLCLNFKPWENPQSSRITCSIAWNISFPWSIIEPETSTKYIVYILPRCPSCQIKQTLSFQCPCSLQTSQEKMCKKEKTEERGRGGPNVGRKQVSNCWQNVKSPEQFSFPICCDASSPELKRPAYISKQLKIIFSSTVLKAKKDISKISLNLCSLNDQLISLWATHFASCTFQSISWINIFWGNDVSLWTTLPVRSWKINRPGGSLTGLWNSCLYLSCFGFDAECFRDCVSQKDEDIKDSSLAIICCLSSLKWVRLLIWLMHQGRHRRSLSFLYIRFLPL